MDNQEILARIQTLVDEEHELRGEPVNDDDAASGDKRAKLKRVAEELDQCWDLLRQRRAKQVAGESPQEAAARPVNQVEGYRQ